MLITFKYTPRNGFNVNYVCNTLTHLQMGKAKDLLLSIAFILASLAGYSGNGIGDDVKSDKITATFSVETFFIKEEVNGGFVCWTAKEEHGSLPYVVELY